MLLCPVHCNYVTQGGGAVQLCDLRPRDVTLYYCNVNGFQTKKESIRTIVDNLQPKVIALCETKLAQGNSVKTLLPEYEVCPGKPTKVGKSGMVICVKLQTFQSIKDVTTTPHDDILSVRICMKNQSVSHIGKRPSRD